MPKRTPAAAAPPPAVDNVADDPRDDTPSEPEEAPARPRRGRRTPAAKAADDGHSAEDFEDEGRKRAFPTAEEQEADDAQEKPARKRRTPPAEPKAPKPSTRSVRDYRFGDIDVDDLEFGTLEDADKFLSVLYYGREGMIKTTNALQMTRLLQPGRVLLINAEGGAKGKALAKHGVDSSRVDVWPQPGKRVTYEGLERLFYRVAADLEKDPASWLGVIWDSGTEIVQTMLDHIVEDVIAEQEEILAKTAGRAGNIKVRDRFDSDRDDYRKMSNMVRGLIRKYRYLPCHFVVTALLRQDEDDRTKKLVYNPAFTPALQTDILGYMDVVAYCRSTRNDGKPVYFATTVAEADDRAKDRFDSLPRELVEPGFDRIAHYVWDELQHDTDPLQKKMPGGGAAGRDEPAKPAAAKPARASRARTAKAAEKPPVPAPDGTPDEAQAAPPAAAEPKTEAAAKAAVQEEIADKESTPARRARASGNRRAGTRTQRPDVTYADEPPF